MRSTAPSAPQYLIVPAGLSETKNFLSCVKTVRSPRDFGSVEPTPGSGMSWDGWSFSAARAGGLAVSTARLRIRRAVRVFLKAFILFLSLRFRPRRLGRHPFQQENQRNLKGNLRMRRSLVLLVRCHADGTAPIGSVTLPAVRSVAGFERFTPPSSPPGTAQLCRESRQNRCF